ncbi:MAG: spherulation-specific family 4 protein [Cyanobacteria bacterium]|nr:spherulation-specific family 4 protein [Cyanobacteriota bacterium]
MKRAIAMLMLMLSATALCNAAVPIGASAPAAPLAPARLAIYYGYPSLVNGASGDVARAAATFADYDVVVFGDGLEFADVNPRRTPAGAGPDEHRRTAAIVDKLRQQSVDVYGYIDLGNSQKLPLPELLQRIKLWAAMKVSGIFFDEAGYDYGVTRERQNAVVDATHALGLGAFVNAFNPDDVFGAARVPINSAGGGNPGGTASQLGANDTYLLESFQVRLGEAENWSSWAMRTRAAVAHRANHGSKIFAVTTTTAPTERNATSLYPYAWWSAAVWGLDGFGWGEPDFSGATSKLPARHLLINPTALAGTQFVSDVIETADGIERRTDAGRIVLSRAGRSGRFIPGQP